MANRSSSPDASAATGAATGLSRFDKDHPHYRWIALSNTTLGMLMATINSSIVIISLPAIFRGIELDPLQPGNVSYLLWIIMGFLVVSAVLVVTLGRLGDIYGRVKMYNLGFAVFSLFSILLSVDPFTGGQGAMWLIVMRIGQGIGGAMLFANSTAILTDAFPAHQRGMALGINQVSAIAGSFLGLILGGLLSEWHWRAVFWVSVPIGVVATIWGYRSLVEHVACGLIRSWEPELVLISAGFDAHRDDPLATCRVTEAGFAGMAASLRRAADGVGAPLGVVLEGGYDVDALANSMATLMPVLIDGSTPSAEATAVDLHPLARDAVGRLQRYWPGLTT